MLKHQLWMTEEYERPRVDTVEQWNIVNTTGDAHPIHLHLVQFQLLNRQKFDVNGYLAATPEDAGLPGTVGEGPRPAPSADAFARGGAKAPKGHELGWMDTVIAYPGDITRIMVPFGAVAGSPLGISYTGQYVWHCHILEHEDNEMMLPYEVMP